MAERTMRVCDRCGKLPAYPMLVMVVPDGSDEPITDPVDLCDRCLATVERAIKRAIKPKEAADATDATE